MEKIEMAREAFIVELLKQEPGDEPYDFNMTLGEIEVYKLRRALLKAIEVYNGKD